ncbi:MAG TPA: hypothetical protein VGO80_07405 [Solirubrobacteraceae bacterium]|jgi:hypothetical protein|nr:hypothetical protein [Solirubrobacteraceae bacterium]
MPGALFRLACTPGNLDGAPEGWVGAMLEQGELALLVDGGGLDAISAVAHRLDLVTVPLLRTEDGPEQQERTVMRYAGSMALVWVAESFGEQAVRWAHDRGPMTLLVETGEPLSDDERKRVERFVVILGRQAE